jgi:hypothetical protein
MFRHFTFYEKVVKVKADVAASLALSPVRTVDRD